MAKKRARSRKQKRKAKPILGLTKDKLKQKVKEAAVSGAAKTWGFWRGPEIKQAIDKPKEFARRRAREVLQLDKEQKLTPGVVWGAVKGAAESKVPQAAGAVARGLMSSGTPGYVYMPGVGLVREAPVKSNFIYVPGVGLVPVAETTKKDAGLFKTPKLTIGKGVEATAGGGLESGVASSLKGAAPKISTPGSSKLEVGDITLKTSAGQGPDDAGMMAVGSIGATGVGSVAAMQRARRRNAGEEMLKRAQYMVNRPKNKEGRVKRMVVSFDDGTRKEKYNVTRGGYKRMKVRKLENEWY